ncbi:TetR/AcrR family transcriptional regulator [Streptomyces curacoi]|uniref:TetR family transcriptional regulator n=1 Tax=Streptomyces curacoi TaxID=146536 RepID=A0A117PF04_9ACTN|nr:TetR/AcrR family transcriptional regulator [Streptomyces curacoi]KUM78489.1 TetR family transcriptional regulator [Streptomyces curacoi]
MERAAPRAGRAVRSVWLEGRARREAGGGRQPSGLDRGRIVAATVRLLDADGLARFSMRRLAAELNVTAMSLYWYVDTKDDLLELALDTAFGELRLPEADAGGEWREQLRALATEYRVLLVRHSWLPPLAGTYLNIGPNALSFSRAVQGVVRRTGLPAYRQMAAVSAVFQFVYGFGTIEGHFLARCADAGLTQDAGHRQAMSAMTQAPEAAEVVREAVEIMAARGGDTVEEMRERDFRYALELLVAGIEAMVARG